MLAHVYLRGTSSPKHSHENEQITYIFEGALRFWIGDERGRPSSSRPAKCSTSPATCPTRPRHWGHVDVDGSPPRETRSTSRTII